MHAQVYAFISCQNHFIFPAIGSLTPSHTMTHLYSVKLYVIDNSELQCRFPKMHLGVEEFKTGHNAHKNVSAFVTCKRSVLCGQLWTLHVVVRSLLCSEIANFAMFRWSVS